MRISTLKELVLYRYRYALGIILLIAFGVILTTWQLGSIPPGFTKDEMASAVAANNLTHLSTSFVNAPYLLLQKASLDLFGPSSLGIRLPSVVLAMLLAFAAFGLLRKWFSHNVTVIGTILIITASHFLLRGRTGSPAIMYSFWTLALLASAALANHQVTGQKFWFWLFCLCAGLSLYTPFFCFIVLFIIVAILLSRQARGIFEEVGQATIAVSIFTFVAVVAPLGYSFYMHPSGILDLVGFTDFSTLAETKTRALYLLQTMVSFTPADSRILVPSLSLPAVALALYGLYVAIRHLGAIRNAIVVLLLALAVVLYISTPSAPYALVFVPSTLLVILGLHAFINKWYVLFPRNPYARIIALFPLAFLLVVMVQFNYTRYFYGLARSEAVRANYNDDILLIEKKLAKQPLLQSSVIVVNKDQQSFYKLLQHDYPNLSIVTPETVASKAGSAIFIVASSEQAAAATVLPNVAPQFLADERPGDALRFRIYRN